MFVDEVPLLFEARKLARQLEVEMWLDPLPFLKALNLKSVNQKKSNVPKCVV